MQVRHAPPAVINCQQYFYQQMVPTDALVHKAYCIGSRVFLVHEPIDATDPVMKNRTQRVEGALTEALVDWARQIGQVTGLSVYGVDFVGRPDAMFVIDVNPFPSFLGLPRAADALWDHLEQIRP